jgi:hypothetical protein
MYVYIRWHTALLMPVRALPLVLLEQGAVGLFTTFTNTVCPFLKRERAKLFVCTNAISRRGKWRCLVSRGILLLQASDGISSIAEIGSLRLCSANFAKKLLRVYGLILCAFSRAQAHAFERTIYVESEHL